MSNTLSETSGSAPNDGATVLQATGVSAPCATPSLVDSLKPTPVDEFERRMQVCRAMHISHLKDGQLEVIFQREPRSLPSLDDLAMRHRQMLDSGGEG